MQKSRREAGRRPVKRFPTKTIVNLQDLGIAAPKSRLDGHDGESNSSGTTGWKSAGGDVSYRDAVLPPPQKRISREQLDKQLIADAPQSHSQYLCKISNDGFTTLARSCLRVVADNIGEKVVQDSLLARIVPFRCVENLCRRVKKRFAGQEIPFSVWQLLVSVNADAMPASMKTYTGLVFDDTEELSSINTHRETTLLDLSNTAFQQTDIYKIRMSFSNSLVALRLDYLTQLEDVSITALSRDVGADQGQAFAKLEILTLRGCKMITDKSAPKIARFTALKLLGRHKGNGSTQHAISVALIPISPDLRGTSCTTATKDILRQLTKPPYISAFTPIHLSLFASLALDETYRQFGRVINTPLVKNTEDLSEAAALVDDPCVLVTALSRLDDTKLLDPRDPIAKKRYSASHHIYGNVYTSVPISKASLGDDGSAEASKGAAFRYGRHANVMGGQLPISQADVGWRRFTKKTKASRLDSAEAPEEEDVGDSDLEITPVQEDSKAIPMASENINEQDAQLSAFHSHANSSEASKPEAQKAILPDRHPLMLLRFIKQSSSSMHTILPVHAELVKPATSASKPVDDEAAVRVKKRPRTSVAETINLPKRFATPISFAEPTSVTATQTSTGPASRNIGRGPTSIMRKASVPSKLAFTNILAKNV